FVHQLQKERARMIAASSGASVFLTEALSLRENTIAAEKDLKDFLQQENRAFSDLGLLNNFMGFRSNLDRGTLNQLEFSNYSRDLLYSFLGRMDENATGINNAEIGRHLLGFKNLAEAKVHLGRIRSSLMEIIKNDSLTLTEYANFHSQKTSYLQSLENFKRYATSTELKEVQNLTSSHHYKQIISLFKEIESQE